MEKINFDNFCDFIKISKNLNISIIFPSKEILKKEYGSEIDKSDYVIRFNDYIIDGYEKYVGTKTDLILVNNETIKKGLIKDKNCFIIGSTRVEQNININLIDYDSVKNNLKNIYDFNLTKDQLPTAGFLIITMLIENKFENINVFGFENIDNGKHKYTYYYKENRNKQNIKTHRYIDELSILRMFDSNKKIKLK
jgi:hypothetical protein